MISIKEKSQETKPFWSLSTEDALKLQNSRLTGLTSEEVSEKQQKYGINSLKTVKKQSSVGLFLNQFKSPVTLILLLAALLSFFLQDPVDALIIVIIVLFSTLLGFWQEKTAGNAVSQLLNLIRVRATVLRDGQKSELPIEEIVPGDIIFLSAGDVIPADCLLIKEDELFVDEAAFTGETFPVEKDVTVLPDKTPLSKRTNSLFMGSHVISGTATALAFVTGMSTEFGHVSQNLGKKAPLTDFERGIKKFGNLLMQITLVMVIFLFGVNVLLHKPVLDSLLFTLAIAVGITPQLLPAIISVNLSQGAKRMAQAQVIVKRLNSIENFGNMNVLCSDKTGTLTEGKVKVDRALDYSGKENKEVLRMAKINAALQQGFKNPIDEAISAVEVDGFKEYVRVDEIPYDFIRKRLSLLIDDGQQHKLITKGAVNQILEVCTKVIDENGNIIPIENARGMTQQLYTTLSEKGYRTLGIAYKDCGDATVLSKTDEQDMIFAGFVSLYDPPKAGIIDTINEFQQYGVRLKIITGDNALIAKSMSQQIGMDHAVILTGGKMREMSDTAFLHRVSKVDVFAEVEPNQKEQIILALKKAGKVVGYMGDGINDVSAIHAADVGLSVNTAVDVAKEAADIVLLNQDLNVLIEGMKEGRRTFANTQKYIFMATSANFGNMFSMAGASLFLSFLPLLPKQVLLTNLMTDLPSMAISSDNVDEEWILKPRSWDIKFIKRFMVSFGLLSSIFDYITFGVLLFVFHAAEQEFHTGWFIESVVSATFIVLVVRTQKTFVKSRPGKYLLLATLFVIFFALALPYLPFAGLLGFVPLPFIFYPVLLAIVALYILFAELMKKWFYKRFTYQ